MMPDTIASVQDRCRVGCSTLGDYHDLAADSYVCIGQLQAEVERLRAAIDCAPHGMGCHSIQAEFLHTPEWGSLDYCDCWKAAALRD